MTPLSDIESLDNIDREAIKLDIFMDITQVMSGNPISHNMLEHQGSFAELLGEPSSEEQIIKKSESKEEFSIKPFDSSCKHCEEIQHMNRDSFESKPNFYFRIQTLMKKAFFTTITSKLNLSSRYCRYNLLWLLKIIGKI